MAFSPDIVLIGEPRLCQQFCQAVGVDPVKNFLQISVKGIRYKVNLQRMSVTEFKKRFSPSRRSFSNGYNYRNDLNQNQIDVLMSRKCKLQTCSLPHGFIILFDADEFAAQYFLPRVLKETLGENSGIDTLLIGSCLNKDTVSAWDATVQALFNIVPLSHPTLVSRGNHGDYKTSFSLFLKDLIECNLNTNLGSFNWEWQRQKSRSNKNCFIL